MKKVIVLGLGLLLLTGCGSSAASDSQETSSSSEDEYSYSSRYYRRSKKSSSSSSVESDSSSSSTSADSEQESTLISFTQLDCEDRGYDVDYGGSSEWNVARQGDRWIVTKSNDSKYNRIKSIYTWDGVKDSGATLIYLLIDGQELVNNLND